jgi:hypothetical protein
MKVTLALMLVLLVGPGIALAQTDDAAAERARLANQRIHAEMERRQREEKQRIEEVARRASMQAEAAVPSEMQPAGQEEQPGSVDSVVIPKTASARPVATTDISKALEQLRVLGELRDAGYVTDEEFARIKRKILDSEF